ncbi:hypothetical protein E4U42_000279 [Claviceps africana]|uniref:Uncharacterized protein n=1 Tax=Claviceps africana TaxID=83212 RepID=A0A8K0J054_9HYPO|nr:hypothetical protein E4U42_000279 [Claviceps africana]
MAQKDKITTYLEIYRESDALRGRLQGGAGAVTINAALRRGRQRQGPQVTCLGSETRYSAGSEDEDEPSACRFASTR